MAEIVDLLYRQPIEKRRQEWLGDVADALQEVQKRQAELTPEKLGQDEQFVTVLHRATELALRTHQQEKRCALRNALLNATLPTAPDLDKQTFFLRLIDELTVNQVLVLELYRDPLGWFKKHGKTPEKLYSAARIEVLNQAYPEIGHAPHSNNLVLGDLRNRGLLGGYDAMVTQNSIYDRISTPLALEFLDYISSG